MRICYVIMPFDSKFDSTYSTAIRPAIAKVSKLQGEAWECVRSDDIRVPGSITKEIITSLYTADLVIADLTGNNPNVLYELGVAHSAGRIVVMITQDITNLPFDINTYRVHSYEHTSDGLQSLGEYLSTTVVDALAGRVRMTNPVQDNAPLHHAEIILNLDVVRHLEKQVQHEVWLIEPSLDTDLKLFSAIIKDNLLNREIAYRYLIPKTQTSFKQYQRFISELGYDPGSHETLEVRTVEPYIIESEVVIYDPYTDREEVMVMSPRERDFIFWYRVGKTRGENIRDRFEILWDTASEPVA